jgi:hypothetical protein
MKRFETNTGIRMKALRAQMNNTSDTAANLCRLRCEMMGPVFRGEAGSEESWQDRSESAELQVKLQRLAWR